MATGQLGSLDWVGYPVGVPVSSPRCGYRGVVDWTGIPCGVVSQPTGGATVVGTRQLPNLHWERLKPFRRNLDEIARRKRAEEEFIALL